MRAQQISRPVRDALRHRSGGVCEICGTTPADVAHHRRPRGMGGSRRPATNQLANLLALCAHDHEFVEWRRDLARQRGWLVKQDHVPRLVPVMRRGEPVWLDDDGGVTPCTDVELVEVSQLLGFDVDMEA